MSTTVTYKGSTLTTVENATKKLTTAGTWLEDDITITDSPSVSYTATITRDDGQTNPRVQVNGTGTTYRNNGATFTFSSGDYLYFYIGTGDYGNRVYLNGELVSFGNSYYTYYPTSDVSLRFRRTDNDSDVYITTPIIPQGTISITDNGDYNVSQYETASVSVAGGNLQAKTNIAPTTSSQTITADSGYDGLSSVQINAMPRGAAGTPSATKGTVSNHAVSVTPSVTNTTGYIIGDTKTGTAVTVSASELVSGTKSISANGTGIDVTNYAAVDVAVPGSSPNLQAKTNIDPTESSQTITADSGYDGLSSVQINAISSTYVGSGITRRSSTDLTASGATVTTPAGYYQSEATKTVASGTEGTPSATKGTVSNHSVSVTPSVTNTAGYISGGTKTGTAVTVQASELVSGSETKTANGTYDVTNLASLVVDVPFVTYYTGSTEPASSLGQNGDIYLQTS